MKKLLSVCLIYKDEENHLNEFLDCFGDMADQIVLVDTGSSDQSNQIVQDRGYENFFFTWCNDFSKAKNYAMSLCTSEWILILDADERMDRLDLITLKDQLKETAFDGFYLPVINLKESSWQTNREDYSSKQYRMNLVRNFKDFHYIYPIHERLDLSLELVKAPISALELNIYHLGYIDSLCEEKSDRNLDLINLLYEEDPENPHLILYHCMGKWSNSLEIYEQLVRSNILSEANQDREQLYRGLILEVKWLEEFNASSTKITKCLDRILQLDPMSGFYHYKKGKLAMTLGNTVKAFEAFNIALDGLMTDLCGDEVAKYEILDNLGVLHAIRGDYDLAEQKFLDLEGHFLRNPST
ncbi:glycosyltransferase family 2 protein, partial [bacterium]|nr:glycosyltransferase family 2 protein [bacterium]